MPFTPPYTHNDAGDGRCIECGLVRGPRYDKCAYCREIEKPRSAKFRRAAERLRALALAAEQEGRNAWKDSRRSR